MWETTRSDCYIELRKIALNAEKLTKIPNILENDAKSFVDIQNFLNLQEIFKRVKKYSDFGDISGDSYELLYLLLEKNRDMLNDKTEGDVCRTEMIIDPLYLV